MSMIKVTSKDAKIHGEGNVREISVEEPAVLGMTSVEELVEALGEELVVNQVKNQLKVAFRAVIRRKLEMKDDNDDYQYSDEAIAEADFSGWKPTLRVTKTPEEKALEALGNLDPATRDAILANFNNT